LACGKVLGELLGEHLLGNSACKLFDERVSEQVAGLVAKMVVPHVEQPIDGASPSQLCTGSNRDRNEPLSGVMLAYTDNYHRHLNPLEQMCSFVGLWKVPEQPQVTVVHLRTLH
jgi:hypothetical protein